MRKTFFTLLAGLLLAACTGKAPEKGALILGEATGFDPQDSVLVFLMKYANGAGKTLVYDSVKDGKFSFRLDSLPSGIEYYMLIFASTRNHCTAGIGPEIYLEPGTLVRIKGEGPRYANARIDSPVKDQKLRTNLRKLIPMEDWDRYADVTTHRQQMIDELRNRKDLTQEIADSLDALITKELADARASHDKRPEPTPSAGSGTWPRRLPTGRKNTANRSCACMRSSRTSRKPAQTAWRS